MTLHSPDGLDRPAEPAEPADPTMLDVLVIGAGQAGLSLAWHLSRTDLRFLVVDAASELGHSWRSRWDSLRLFTPSQYDGLPGMPFPAPADTYPTKDEVADYLATYARRFDLPVLLDTRVQRLVRERGSFRAHTRHGVLRARQVVVATGAFQVPAVPEVSTQFSDRVEQLHSSSYRNPSRLPGGHVLVVGGGNSGLQIAEELSGTHRVTLAVGTTPPRLPQRLLGKDLFWWMTRLGMLSKPADSRLARRLRARGDLVVGSRTGDLVAAGVALRPRLVGAEGRTARFADGGTAEVDAVVWATGFRPDYSWLQVPDVVVDGQVRHREGITDVAGLCFLGLAWQRTRGSSLVGFVQQDAKWLLPRLVAGAGAGAGDQSVAPARVDA